MGRERQVRESDMNNLAYLIAIVKETLRLYPAALLSVPHESLEDCTAAGYGFVWMSVLPCVLKKKKEQCVCFGC